MEADRRRDLLRTLVEIPIAGVLAVLIVIVIRAMLVQPFYIPSASMTPQLRIDDKILVSRLSYRLHPVHRGDLVVFDAPPGAVPETVVPPAPKGISGWWHTVAVHLGLVPRTDELIKRVIGLPGETVAGHDGHVYIDGRLLLEPYLPLGLRTEAFAPHVVPAGMLWVMGDNRLDSKDSTYFGPIPQHTVVGRAFLKIWPLDNISFL